MRNLTKLFNVVTTLLLMLFVASCTPQADYTNLIPKDVKMVAKVNLEQLCDKAGLADNETFNTTIMDKLSEADMSQPVKEKLEEIFQDPSTIGVDFSLPLYCIVHDKEGIIIGAVLNRADMEETFDLMSITGECESVEKHELLSYTVVDKMLVAFDDTKFLVYPMSYRERQDKSLAFDVVDKYFAQTEEQSAVINEGFDKMLNNPADAAIYMPGKTVSELVEDSWDRDIRKMRQLMEKSNVRFEEMDWMTSLTFKAGETVLEYDVIPQTYNMKEIVKQGDEAFKEIAGNHFKYIEKKALGVWACGLDGAKCLDYFAAVGLDKVFAGEEVYNEILTAVNCIDGDITFALNEIEFVPKGVAMIDTKDDALFRLVEEALSEGVTKVSDSHYRIGGQIPGAFGQDGDKFYVLIGYTTLEEAEEEMSASEFTSDRSKMVVMLEEILDNPLVRDAINREFRGEMLALSSVLNELHTIETEVTDATHVEIKLTMKDSDSNLLESICGKLISMLALYM